MTEEQIYDENQKKQVNKLVDDMTLFDDDLMGHVFDKNIEATELILRIILGEDIRVISVTGQDELKNPIVGGRDITLDVHAIDSNGREIDIEVQGNASGAVVERARFHSSMVDARMLKSGQDFKALKDSYVIFIYKHDKFREGKPLYHIDRYVRETGKLFEDGSHIIYVNGSYKGDDEIARLMEDFHQKESEGIHFKALADGVKHFKETEEGREIMCESVEKYAEEYGQECARKQEIKTKIDIARDLIKDAGFSIDQAVKFLKIGKDQRDFFVSQLQK